MPFLFKAPRHRATSSFMGSPHPSQRLVLRLGATRRALWPLFLVAMVLAGASAFSEEEDSNRTYAPIRNDENWAWLRSSEGPAIDLWDPIKYVRLVSDRDD